MYGQRPKYSRRHFAVGMGTILASQTVNALQICPAPDLPAGTCSVMLDPARFAGLNTPAQQKNTQWCWAACIEMVCRWYGVRLSQQSIVARVYGGLVNMPADDRNLTAALNSKWTADDGTSFRIQASVFSPAMGQANVDNQRMIQDLANERPLIVGARTHATVLARVDYVEGPYGQPIVQRAHVIDPWPGAAPPPQFARSLQPDEMTPIQMGGTLRYLASISVS